MQQEKLQEPGHRLASSDSGSVPNDIGHMEQPWNGGLESMYLQRTVPLGSRTMDSTQQWWLQCLRWRSMLRCCRSWGWSTGIHSVATELGAETWMCMEQLRALGSEAWGRGGC